MNRAKRLHSILLALGSATLVAACGGSSSGGTVTQPDECSIASQNETIYDIMQQWYLWYDELPVVDPASFSSQQALLDALIAPVADPVDRFSYLTTQAEEDALFSASQFIGFGFRQQVDGDSVTILDVFEGGPAAAGGLDRGSSILAIDGVPIADILAIEGGLTDALGPREIGFEVELTFRNQAGAEITSTLVKDTVTIPPVTATQVFDLDGVTTGYLVFRNFVDPGIAALNTAFTEFSSAGVTQLIVDLRYNGGGLLRVAEYFANLLASRDNPGLPFYSLWYNDQNSGRNETFLLAANPLSIALSLDKVVFITTPATASASELLINGLPPYVETVTVGSTTFGKPVGQSGFRFCEQVLRPVTFEFVNALGEGDFFDGIGPDCVAGDDPTLPFGAAGESSFDTAVQWLSTGACPQVAAEAFQQLEREPARKPRWRLNDAY
ncbi:S41 family peptidase [Thioalkalivibrio sp. XN8]|uniref:S41 family peptidase n=1 Tax=Thioalkalivibrio sp. XN8 TaxID=2712863 RepID=UPI0013ED6657|nr:S41 family peptidase [Thioalkalivibrio sp. XN8]NGP52730.1 PDZ domain-containing protein [Thioalkalivibrio sp. XN8]